MISYLLSSDSGYWLLTSNRTGRKRDIPSIELSTESERFSIIQSRLLFLDSATDGIYSSRDGCTCWPYDHNTRSYETPLTQITIGVYRRGCTKRFKPDWTHFLNDSTNHNTLSEMETLIIHWSITHINRWSLCNQESRSGRSYYQSKALPTLETLRGAPKSFPPERVKPHGPPPDRVISLAII